jgi:hypothetical protein
MLELLTQIIIISGLVAFEVLVLGFGSNSMSLNVIFSDILQYDSITQQFLLMFWFLNGIIALLGIYGVIMFIWLHFNIKKKI